MASLDHSAFDMLTQRVALFQERARTLLGAPEDGKIRGGEGEDRGRKGDGVGRMGGAPLIIANSVC